MRFGWGELGRGADLVAVERLVVGALLMGELHPHHHLLLLWQVLNIFLHAAKKNGAQLRLHPKEQLSGICHQPCDKLMLLVQTLKGLVSDNALMLMFQKQPKVEQSFFLTTIGWGGLGRGGGADL